MGRWLVLFVLALLVAPSAQAWRCGQHLVTEGDSGYEVVRYCGEPDYVDRQAEAFVAGIGFVGELEEWYYNEGPQQLIRILHFRNGDLTAVKTAGHGFTRFIEGDCSPYDLDRGMTKYELLLRCGEPVYRDSRWELPHGGGRFYGVPSRVDEWVYEFRSGQFAREVRIVDGRVVDVQLGDR